MVPDALLHDLSQRAEVKALECVEVYAILFVCVVPEKSMDFGELLCGCVVKRGFVRHLLQCMPGRGLSQAPVVHCPTYLSDIVLLIKELFTGMRIAERD